MILCQCIVGELYPIFSEGKITRPLRGGILYNFIRMRYSIDSQKISPCQKQLSMGGDVQQIEEAT